MHFRSTFESYIPWGIQSKWQYPYSLSPHLTQGGLFLALLAHYFCAVQCQFAAKLLLHMCFACMALQVRWWYLISHIKTNLKCLKLIKVSIIHYYYPYQTSEQVISFMVLPSLSMPEWPRWEYILYFPWSRLSYWLWRVNKRGQYHFGILPRPASGNLWPQTKTKNMKITAPHKLLAERWKIP